MPATEQTWRDTKLLHKVFGVSSALMLLATIWMFAADHAREWKPIQRTANRMEMTLTDWRKLQFGAEESVLEHRQLVKELENARRQSVAPGLVEAFKQEVQSAPATQDYSFQQIDGLVNELNSAAGQPDAEDTRDDLIEALRDIVVRARYREDSLLGERKFKSADRDAAVAALGILVRDSGTLSPDEAQRLQAEKQAEIDGLKRDLDDLSSQYELAKEHRTDLEKIVKQITQDEDAANEALAKNEAELEQLQKSNVERRSTYITWFGYVPLPGKKILELPILDAFNSPRKIDNLWSTGNVIDYNFSKVRRFDRCTTCHQGIQSTMPGSADKPAYLPEQVFQVRIEPRTDDQVKELRAKQLQAAEQAKDEELIQQVSAEVDQLPVEQQLELYLGLRIADEGLLKRTDATVKFVWPESPAATAIVLDEDAVTDTGADIRSGLLMDRLGPLGGKSNQRPGLTAGDVVHSINDLPVMHADKVAIGLLDASLVGKPFTVTVRRGMPNPYVSHPRLDLFVGSLSPHKMSEFACTICHEGQGSATSFKWASHSPSTVRERKDWGHEHGWFDNPHWIFPMYPERFAESACLKCHHRVTELEPSDRFPDSPAPKVTHGYHLISKYGCFGCHEINGYDAGRSIGPDLRLEPNFFAAAQQLKYSEGSGYEQLTDDEKYLIEQVIDHPDRDAVRHQLVEAIEADAKAETPKLSPDVHDKLLPLLKDVDTPGTLRKAGPSLRFTGHKLDAAFLYDWIREPKHFRDNTRMPQFFGLWNHLHHSPGLEHAKDYEPLEILGIAKYLQKVSQPFDYLQPPADVTETADAGRGRTQFQTRGCLACHTHKEFADANSYRPADAIVQGPDLSGVGEKFAGENGRKWLYSWIKEPTRYHARTVMPDLFLDPVEVEAGKVTDPAADIVEFLLAASKVGWQPKPDTLTSADQVDAQILDRFVTENLAETFALHRAEQFAGKGVPESLRGELKGAEVELIVAEEQRNDPNFKLTGEQKLLYLGRKSIGKYGCYGCHDIPGFEDAKPIGTTLADWGRKDSAKLAFEHITHYLEGHHVPHEDDHAVVLPASSQVPEGPGAVADESEVHAATPAERGALAHDTRHDHESEEDKEYFLEQIKSGHRAGFIYQKLREPRSYDYHKTENKRYNERLRMPEFPFTAEEREAVITFVLGLVADPPADKYIYRPDSRASAILAGKRVIEKYNCGGCHILSAEKWQVAHSPGAFGEQAEVKTYPFVRSHFSPAALEASVATDRSGLTRTTVEGVPAVDDNGLPIVYDDAGDPLEEDAVYSPRNLEFAFELWKPTPLDGSRYDVGVMALSVFGDQLEKRYPTDGGFLTKYLLPQVVALEKQVNPQAKGGEAWGWLPPPLMGEGSKVQTDWLHDFLLNPYPIRPATFLRMPRFNMSPEEATQLVNYFAAVDGAEYPYAFQSRRQSAHLAAESREYEQRLQEAATADSDDRSRLTDAMRVVVNNNYCVKCHIIGDFEPTGSDRAKAPNLAVVYQRLRPDYLRKWIANPKSILPYTSMPVNIPFDPDAPNLGGISQDLYHGTSAEQVDALVDLLMNYDEFAKQRSSVTDLVKQYGGPPAPADGTAPAAPPPATPPAAPATGATGEATGGN